MWSEFTEQATGARALGARPMPMAMPRAASRSGFQRLRQKWFGGKRGKDGKDKVKKS